MQTLVSELPTSNETLALRERLTKLEQLASLKQEQSRRTATRKILQFYPDSGPLRRELYPKHIEFFRLGATTKQRLAMCANRVGKTEGMGGYEVSCHLTGDYPDWWEGYRFAKPITCWACGETSKDVRDSLQKKLCGPIYAVGTGLIMGDHIGRHTMKSGVPDAFDTLYVKHAAGGLSSLAFKSYDQGRESFQAADVDLLWLDEEPPIGIYAEAVTRTMTTNGLVILTFTPLQGMSETVLQFLPKGDIKEYKEATRSVIIASWDDAPHLTQQMKDEMLATYPAFQRDARSKGIPQLGSGAIYPVPETEFVCDPFKIPDHWPRGYGMDVGWNNTAALWGAKDRESGIVYLYHAYKRQHAEPSVHAAAIRAAGDWLPGFIDPASRGRGQKDGSQLLSDYRDLGLRLSLADNGVESGLYSVWNRLSTGRYKLFRNCSGFLEEYRLYRRDEQGRVVKANDHLMDCWRYLDSRIEKFEVKPVEVQQPRPMVFLGENSQNWMS